MRYRVVAADLDGTLLGKDHRLSEFTQQTLKSLSQQRIELILATGRHHLDVKHIRQHLGIESFMITSNGARAHDSAGGLFSSADLPLNIVCDLLEMVKDSKALAANTYCEEGWFSSAILPDLAAFYRYSNFNYQLLPKNLLTLESICKVFYMGEHKLLLQLEQEIIDRWGVKLNVSFSHLNCLEVMAEGVSKGKTLERVLQHQGFSLKECIAFGDGMNDLEMLSMVGKGCIMENADQRLKQSLPALEVISNHQQDGVAHYLRTHFF